MGTSAVWAESNESRQGPVAVLGDADGGRGSHYGSMTPQWHLVSQSSSQPVSRSHSVILPASLKACQLASWSASQPVGHSSS